MTKLAQSIINLAGARGVAAKLAGSNDRLSDVPDGGVNPGALSARAYLPASLQPGAPLVVVLHGCTQTPAGYDHGTGWSALADRHGFALLFPEQARANNPNLCFNWFNPVDIGRTGGEAQSIADMITAMLARHDLDAGRVFITGLSAGGAMTAVMLATYPELFRGGAIIGGLPYACASGVPEALARMRGQGLPDGAKMMNAVIHASNRHDGPWPSISLWHGTADATVHPSNMDRLGDQWRRVHGIEKASPDVTTEQGWTHRVWQGPEGRALVEEWSIHGMGHGVPLDPHGPDRLGVSGPFMLDAGLSSTAVIATGWSIASASPGRVARSQALIESRPTPAKSSLPPHAAKPAAGMIGIGGIQRTIEDALRSAGLMR